jgi:nucleotide-binding universal stress UspA family protein
MRTIIVPVDASPCSDRVVQEIIKLSKASGPADLHLINVQPRIFTESALMFTDASKIDTYYYEQADRALAPAEKALTAAGIAFTVHRLVGPVAETLVAKAKELNADGIVMGTHGHGRVTGMLLGSVSNKVLHLAPMPVTLVRGEPPIDFAGRLSAS